MGVVYLRSSVLAGRCLPAVLTSTCGAIASTAGVNLSIPPVAPADVPAIFHPRIGTSTCGATDIYLRCYIDNYLRCYHLRGGRTFEYTSGGSCGRACIIPPKNLDIYLRCYRHLPAVLKRAYPAGDVYLRWLLHRAWQDACHLDNYLRCYRLHGGCGFEYTSGGSCGCACIIPPKILGHLPPVGQRCLPAVLLMFTSGGFAYTRRE